MQQTEQTRKVKQQTHLFVDEIRASTMETSCVNQSKDDLPIIFDVQDFVNRVKKVLFQFCYPICEWWGWGTNGVCSCHRSIHLVGLRSFVDICGRQTERYDSHFILSSNKIKVCCLLRVLIA